MRGVRFWFWNGISDLGEKKTQALRKEKYTAPALVRDWRQQDVFGYTTHRN